MMMCVICNEWFHPRCVGLPAIERGYKCRYDCAYARDIKQQEESSKREQERVAGEKRKKLEMDSVVLRKRERSCNRIEKKAALVERGALVLTAKLGELEDEMLSTAGLLEQALLEKEYILSNLGELAFNNIFQEQWKKSLLSIISFNTERLKRERACRVFLPALLWSRLTWVEGTILRERDATRDYLVFMNAKQLPLWLVGDYDWVSIGPKIAEPTDGGRRQVEVYAGIYRSVTLKYDPNKQGNIIFFFDAISNINIIFIKKDVVIQCSFEVWRRVRRRPLPTSDWNEWGVWKAKQWRERPEDDTYVKLLKAMR